LSVVSRLTQLGRREARKIIGLRRSSPVAFVNGLVAGV
jgi:hypothetical protein